jgi:hypothetical protein
LKIPGIQREERRYSSPHEREQFLQMSLEEKRQHIINRGENMPMQTGNGRRINVSVPAAAIVPLLTALAGFFGNNLYHDAMPTEEDRKLESKLVLMEKVEAVADERRVEMLRRLENIEITLKDLEKSNTRILAKLRVQADDVAVPR